MKLRLLARPAVAACLTCCLLLIPAALRSATAADGKGKPIDVTLTKRVDSAKPYGKSAYSFRFATQDDAKHKNYVDLVFNGCGLLHVTPVSGMTSKVTDLGEVQWEESPDSAPADAAWRSESIRPQANHLYLQQVVDGDGRDFLVKFLITKATDDTIELKWAPVDPAKPVAPLPPGRGAAGKMGQCGGKHDEE